jgi:hypothetical protein
MFGKPVFIRGAPLSYDRTVVAWCNVRRLGYGKVSRPKTVLYVQVQYGIIYGGLST